jgi:modulator of FtsH protease HflK
VLGAGRAEVAADTQVLMQQALHQYQSGLEVVTVNLQQAQPPEPVQPAFADAVMAREDRVRFRNMAQSYANGIIPRARGQAARIEQEAIAYREQVIAAARGDTARFRQVLEEYREAPEVMRDRLYLDAMQAVLSNSSKVMMDVDGGNNLLYLPLGKLMRQRGAAADMDAMRNLPLSSVGGLSNHQADEREARSFGREER